MNWEHSCGAVLYQLKNGEPYYILVEGSSGFGFPKGHMEANESEIQTAVREIWEETGVHAVVDQSFCRSVEYPVLKKKDTCKKITFFIATYPEEETGRTAGEAHCQAGDDDPQRQSLRTAAERGIHPRVRCP